MGQERVTIGNELAGLFLAVQGQFFNDDTQVGQTFVDVIGLFEPLPSGSSFFLSLTACQIHQVYHGDLFGCRFSYFLPLNEFNSDYSVCS